MHSLLLMLLQLWQTRPAVLTTVQSHACASGIREDVLVALVCTDAAIDTTPTGVGFSFYTKMYHSGQMERYTPSLHVYGVHSILAGAFMCTKHGSTQQLKTFCLFFSMALT